MLFKKSFLLLLVGEGELYHALYGCVQLDSGAQSALATEEERSNLAESALLR